MLADTNAVRALEACVTLEDGAVVETREPLLEPLGGPPHNRVFPRFHAPHVDGDLAVDHDAEVSGSASDVDCARARHQRLGRSTADVHAGPAETLALDDRHLLTRASQLGRQSGAGLPGADHDGVKRACHGHPADI